MTWNELSQILLSLGWVEDSSPNRLGQNHYQAYLDDDCWIVFASTPSCVYGSDLKPGAFAKMYSQHNGPVDDSWTWIVMESLTYTPNNGFSCDHPLVKQKTLDIINTITGGHNE